MGQYFSKRNDWKKQRKEVLLAFGVGNFLGDLGGRNAIGTDYSFVDLELVLTRPSAMLGYRYRFSKNWGLRTQFDFTRVNGDDKLTTEKFRNNRNLHFRSNIFELSANIEYAFVREHKGNRYHIKHTFKRRSKAYSTYLYVFGGIGAFYFNPKAKYQGTWVALRPLCTEGQGIIPGKKKYSPINFSIPLGVGYKVTVNQQWAFGLEFNFRKTFTDYLDDVSSTYVDNGTLYSTKGPIAAAVADPNQGNFPVQLDGSGKSKEGMQRGDIKQKDAYMTLMLTFGYYLKSSKTKKKTRSKF
jgi:hypothetical protein